MLNIEDSHKQEMQAFKIDKAQESTARISDLESQLDNLKKSYESQIDLLSDESIKEHVRVAEEAAELSYKKREISLQRRIDELETLLESQGATIDSLRSEISKIEREMAMRVQAKDALIESYEEKLSFFKKEFHDRVFAVEVHKLRMEVDEMRFSNSDLKNKYDILFIEIY